jgi:XTP/dITP diphosphohydrolase
MKILLATNNMHKKEEFEQILHQHDLLLPTDLGIDFDAEETETTFFGNAFLKAKTLLDMVENPLDMAVIADDSGLVVPALGGEPGIYSARYGSDVYGRMLETEERNAYLLEKMEGIDDRRAFFVCAMVALFDENRFLSAQETFEGVISKQPRGTNGFGYDPLLYLPDLGLTAAELSPEQKHELSHRGKAARRLSTLLS